MAHRRDQDVHALHHQLGSRHWARKGERPGIGVEHRHHGHDRVAGVDPECIGARDRHGMEHIGPVGIDHTFGIACRSAGYSNGAGTGLRLIVIRFAARHASAPHGQVNDGPAMASPA